MTQFLVLAQQSDGDITGRLNLVEAATKMEALNKVFGDRPPNNYRVVRAIVFEVVTGEGIDVHFREPRWAGSDTWQPIGVGT